MSDSKPLHNLSGRLGQALRAYALHRGGWIWAQAVKLSSAEPSPSPQLQAVRRGGAGVESAASADAGAGSSPNSAPKSDEMVMRTGAYGVDVRFLPHVRVSIPVGRAALCLNAECEAVFFIALNRCPACTGMTFAPLSQFLNRRAG